MESGGGAGGVYGRGFHAEMTSPAGINSSGAGKLRGTQGSGTAYDRCSSAPGWWNWLDTIGLNPIVLRGVWVRVPPRALQRRVTCHTPHVTISEWSAR